MREIVEFNRKTNETVTRVTDDDGTPITVTGVHNITGRVRSIYPGRMREADFVVVQEELPDLKPDYDRAYIRSKIASARTRAIQHNMVFNIRTQDILNLLESQDNRCYYTGLPFIDTRALGDLGAANKFMFSIDRKDSMKGYTIDNIVLCMNIINTSKGIMSAEEYIQRCFKETKDAYRAVGWDKEPTIEDIFGYAVSRAEYNNAIRKMRALQK